jgi:soluble lytic murein transglycosylase
MSRGDKERLLAAAAALKARQYPTAVTLIDLVSDPIAKGLGQWMYFMAEDPSVDFNVADSFLDSNPDWPARTRIHAFVEKKIPSSAPADQVLAFFDTREPVTGIGKIRLAKALFSVGDKIGGEQQIRDAWLNESLTLAEVKQILADYAGRLTKEDHAARVDRLLWGNGDTSTTLYRSTDGGASFSIVSSSLSILGTQGWYASALWVDPSDTDANTANDVIDGAGLDIWRSTNGGTSVTQESQWFSAPTSAHADHHAIIESTIPITLSSTSIPSAP